MPISELSTSRAPLPSAVASANPRPAEGQAASQTGRSPPSGGGAESASTEAPKESEVAHSVERLNELIKSVRRELHFSVDDASGHTVITVIDAETQQVVRQIPPEEVLSVVQRLQSADHSLLTGVRA